MFTIWVCGAFWWRDTSIFTLLAATYICQSLCYHTNDIFSNKNERPKLVKISYTWEYICIHGCACKITFKIFYYRLHLHVNGIAWDKTAKTRLHCKYLFVQSKMNLPFSENFLHWFNFSTERHLFRCSPCYVFLGNYVHIWQSSEINTIKFSASLSEKW